MRQKSQTSILSKPMNMGSKQQQAVFQELGGKLSRNTPFIMALQRSGEVFSPRELFACHCRDRK